MSNPATLLADLRAHLAVCEELFRVIERENHLLHGAETAPPPDSLRSRQRLLPLLDTSLQKLRSHRRQRPEPPCPNSGCQPPEVLAQIRLIQDLLMKTLLLDRENEQIRLRRGVHQAARLAQGDRPQPHFVLDLYRRYSQI